MGIQVAPVNLAAMSAQVVPAALARIDNGVYWCHDLPKSFCSRFDPTQTDFDSRSKAKTLAL
jgi:hypothetical protein